MTPSFDHSYDGITHMSSGPKKDKSRIGNFLTLLITLTPPIIYLYYRLETMFDWDWDHINLEGPDEIIDFLDLLNEYYSLALIILGCILIYAIFVKLFGGVVKVCMGDHKLYPLTLLWETKASCLLLENGSINPNMPRFLQNRPGTKLSYTIKLHEDIHTLYITISRSRWLIPHRHTNVSKFLQQLMISNELEVELVNQIPSTYYRFTRYLRSKGKVPDLRRLITSAQQYDLQNVEVSTAIQFEEIIEEDTSNYFSFKDKQNSTDQKSKSFIYTCILKISASDEDELNILDNLTANYCEESKFGYWGKIIAKKSVAYHLMKLPKLKQLDNPNMYQSQLAKVFASEEPTQKGENAKWINTGNTKHSQVIGTSVINNKEILPFAITPSDLAKGGIIAGAIGTGKTNLRLNLMQLMHQSDVRIIDFDLKGDVRKYPWTKEWGKVIDPTKNLTINPFECPPCYSKRKHADVLTRIFIETIPDRDELTPPQRHMLMLAIQKTVKMEGTAHDFFNNLLIVGRQEQGIIDNNQENTAKALLVKFNWMQGNLREIFWHKENSLSRDDLLRSSLLFDLSSLSESAKHEKVRFVMNLVMARMMSLLPDTDTHGKLKTAIFIDEAQILMPKHNHDNLTKMEETVSTLRYKGISVIAAGVSADLMSSILLDVGFVAQFRSESASLYRSLGLTEKEEQKNITQLDPYHAYIRAQSSRSIPMVVKLHKFTPSDSNSSSDAGGSLLYSLGGLLGSGNDNTPQNANNEYNEKVIAVEPVVSTELPEFRLDFNHKYASRIDALIEERAPLSSNHLQLLQAETRNFMSSQFPSTKYDESKGLVNEMIYKAVERYQELDSNQALPAILVKYPMVFLYQVVRYVLMQVLSNLEHSKKLNLYDKNLEQIVHDSLNMANKMGNVIDRVRSSPEVPKYRRLIKQYRSVGKLSEDEELALLTATASTLGQILKQSLGPSAEEMGLHELLQVAQDSGIINSTQSSVLHVFRQHRNEVMHEGVDTIKLNSDLIIKSATLLDELQSNMDPDNLAPLYSITDE